MLLLFQGFNLLPRTDAIKNVQKYAKNEGFVNLQGQTQEFGPAISFDSKGVEFGQITAQLLRMLGQ